MNHLGVGHLADNVLYPLAELFESGGIVTGNADLDGRFHNHPLLQLLHNHERFGRRPRHAAAQFVHQCRRGLFRFGIDNHLPVGSVRKLRIHVVIEARSALAHEARKVGHFGTGAKAALDAPHGFIGGLDARTLRHPHIHHKLVALGRRKELVGNEQVERHSRDDRRQSQRHRQWLAMHEEDDRPVVDRLQPVQRSRLARGSGRAGRAIVKPLTDEEPAQQRRQQHGDYEGYRERHGHRDRQSSNELPHRTRENQQRQERSDDRQRRRKHRHHHLAHRLPGSLAPRYAAVQAIHIVVRDDDGVVHHNAEHYNQGRDRNLVQLNANRVQNAERGADSHRNGHRRNHGDAKRQQNDGHQNDRANGEQKLAPQVGHALLHHGRLVGHQVEMDVRRQNRLERVEDVADLLAKLHDVPPLLHLDRKQNGRLAVVSYDEGGVLIAPFHIGEVADINRLPGSRNVHQHTADLVFRGEQARRSQRHLDRLGVQAPGAPDDVSLLQRLNHAQRIGEVLRQPFQAAGDPDLLVLLAVGGQLTHVAHGAQLVLDAVRIIVEFAISIALAVNGNEHCHGVAEVGIDQRPDHAFGQFHGARLVHFMAQLGPEGAGVLDVVLQVHDDEHEPGPAGGIRLLLVYLRELEDVFFQLLGDLFLHLFGCGAGVGRQHHSLADGDARVFRPRHGQQGVHTDTDG